MTGWDYCRMGEQRPCRVGGAGEARPMAGEHKQQGHPEAFAPRKALTRGARARWLLMAVSVSGGFCAFGASSLH